MTRIVLPLVWIAVSMAPAAAADWQWSILVRGGLQNQGNSRAYLWIPPDCEKVRGVVFAQHNMEEESLLENPIFRQALGELKFAEIWCAPRWDLLFHFDQGAGETLIGMLSDLAAASGYDELKFAPLVGLGHSAAASMPYYLAVWNPERNLAALSVSGQWPYVRGQFAPDIWGPRKFDGIPALESMGEYEAANTWSREGLKERQQHPQMPLSMLANPAQGHFASSDAKVRYLALYLKKAAQYRLPVDAEPSLGELPKLKPIDPTKTGWLVDKWRFDEPPLAPPAPVDQYTGDPKEAFWYFDEELARATEAYQAAYPGRKPQLVGYLQDGELAPQRNEHLQVNLKFQPEPDGATFKLLASFYATVPGGSPRPAVWTGQAVGTPLGHAIGGGPIQIDRICGPFEKLGPDTFAVRLTRDIIGVDRQYELVFAATHSGDEQYKPAVQQAHMLIPAKNFKGAEQRISFPEIPNQSRGATKVKLSSMSDADVAVSYCVLSGPAELHGDELQLTPIPPRAKYPVKVTVIAWQYGRSVTPLLKTAEPVERSFYILK